VTDNALNQVLAYVIALTHPDQKTLLWIGEEKAANVQLNGATTEGDYIAFRKQRDATLAAPRLLYPSLQVNICAGRLPAADVTGRRFLRLPISGDFRA